MSRRRGSGAAGLLGLGGYGLGLCAVGVAGIAAPLLPAAHPGSDGGGLAQGGSERGAVRGLPLPLRGAGSPGALLSADPTVAPLLMPVGAVASTAGVSPVALAGRARTAVEFRPTLFMLPSGRTAQIQPAGLLSDGSLAVPTDPKVVGWWTGGALAGEVFGSTVIAGHVDSMKYGLGAFAELTHARKGTVLELRSGSHRQRYRVVGVLKVPQARLTSATAAFSQEVPHRLVVITCGGPFDRARHRYLDNVVVTAIPIR
jgi:hypothetical protein